MRAKISVIALAAACGVKAPDGGDSAPSTGAYQLWDYFPLDGQRSWEYASDDMSVDHELVVRLAEGTTSAGDAVVHRLERYNEDTGAALGATLWSSDSVDGVQIHGYETDAGDAVDFPEPVLFAPTHGDPGDAVESSAGGWDFTSTFEAVEPCPNHWVGEEWDSCLHLRLDDGDGGAPFAGDYWLVPRYGAAWLRTTDDTDTWFLVKANWEPAD